MLDRGNQTGEHETTLNGIRIHYTIRGSGPPLIAISGGPGMDARGWGDFGGSSPSIRAARGSPAIHLTVPTACQTTPQTSMPCGGTSASIARSLPVGRTVASSPSRLPSTIRTTYLA